MDGLLHLYLCAHAARETIFFGVGGMLFQQVFLLIQWQSDRSATGNLSGCRNLSLKSSPERGPSGLCLTISSTSRPLRALSAGSCFQEVLPDIAPDDPVGSFHRYRAIAELKLTQVSISLSFRMQWRMSKVEQAILLSSFAFLLDCAQSGSPESEPGAKGSALVDLGLMGFVFSPIHLFYTSCKSWGI